MRYRLSGLLVIATRRNAPRAVRRRLTGYSSTQRVASRSDLRALINSSMTCGAVSLVFRRAGRVANRRPNVYAWAGRSARRRQSAPYESPPWRCVGGRNVQEQTQSPHGSAADLAGRAMREYLDTVHPRADEPGATLWPNRAVGGSPAAERPAVSPLDFSEPIDPTAFDTNVLRPALVRSAYRPASRSTRRQWPSKSPLVASCRSPLMAR
jgi:hypothetical protein